MEFLLNALPMFFVIQGRGLVYFYFWMKIVGRFNDRAKHSEREKEKESLQRHAISYQKSWHPTRPVFSLLICCIQSIAVSRAPVDNFFPWVVFVVQVLLLSDSRAYCTFCAMTKQRNQGSKVDIETSAQIEQGWLIGTYGTCGSSDTVRVLPDPRLIGTEQTIG